MNPRNKNVKDASLQLPDGYFAFTHDDSAPIRRANQVQRIDFAGYTIVKGPSGVIVTILDRAARCTG